MKMTAKKVFSVIQPDEKSSQGNMGEANLADPVGWWLLNLFCEGWQKYQINIGLHQIAGSIVHNTGIQWLRQHLIV